MPSDPVVLDAPSERSRPGVLASVRTHARAVVASFVVGAVLGFVISSFLPTEYTAESSLYLRVEGPFTPGDQNGGDAVRFGADQAEILLTAEVLQRAGDRVVPPVSVLDLQKTVTATSAADTSKVTVTVVAPEAEQARAIADAVVVSYREIVSERVKAAADAAEAALGPVPTGPTAAAADAAQAIQAMIQEIRLRASAYGDGVATVEPALLPEAPSAPLPLQNALLGGLFALFLTTGVFVLRDQRRARQASVADLDLLLGAPLLSRFPAPRTRSVSDMVVTSSVSEQFRAGHDVLTAIDVRLEGARRPSVLFLSWQQSLATTALVVSVGLAAARENRQVVLVDGGAKERGISSLTDVAPGLGLEGLLNRATPLNAALRTWRVGDSELDVVPLDGWSPAPTSAAARPQILRAAIDRLRAETPTALTLVDGPPLTERSLGLALGRGVDGIVLVIDAETTVDDAHEMGRHLGLAGVAVLGYVLVGPAGRRAVARSSGGGRTEIDGPDSADHGLPAQSTPDSPRPSGGRARV